jgi:DNA-binding transcriptional MerR regulator
MYTIGEFSRITGLTVKALRFYHEQALLVPASVDPQSGYRYYDDRNVERARAIALLRRLEFPVEQIGEVLAQTDHEGALLDAMERHKRTLDARVRRLKQAVRSIDRFLDEHRHAAAMAAQGAALVAEKEAPAVWVAGVRMRGHYAECGKGFARIGRAMGRHVNGAPMLLHYDGEYREEDADFEACMPLRPGRAGRDLRPRDPRRPGGHARAPRAVRRDGARVLHRLPVRPVEGIHAAPADARGVSERPGHDLQGQPGELRD